MKKIILLLILISYSLISHGQQGTISNRPTSSSINSNLLSGSNTWSGNNYYLGTNIYISGVTLQSILNAKQALLTGTGFVKSLAGTISYDNNNYLTGITSSNVTTALGYTPYNNTNPSGYITSSSLNAYFPIVGGTLTGTGGNGFHGFIAQSSNPSTPSSGFNLFANSTNALSWKGTNGFVRTFDGTSNTADRTYTLPDASGTFSLLGNNETHTGNKSYTGTFTIGNGTTGVINLGDASFSKTVGSGFIFNSSIVSNSGITASGAIILNGSQGIGIGVTPTTKLDIQGTTATDSAPLGTELLTSSNWTSTGWTGSFGAGYTHTTGNTTVLSNTLVPSSGQFYQITYTVTGRTAGTFDILFGGVSTTGLSATGASGIYTTSTGILSITPTSTFDGTIVISIKQIGNSTALITYRNSSGAVAGEKRVPVSYLNNFDGVNSGYRITTGLYNTFYGALTGTSNTTGDGNTFIGYNAGNANTTFSSNTFIGFNSGRLSKAYSNTFVGSSSGTNNTTGTQNNFFGSNAGSNTTTANGNNFFGTASGNTNITGANNAFFGDYTGFSNNSGNTNSAFGSLSLFSNISGNNNISFGYQAGRYISGGSTANTIPNNSTFLGYNTQALADNQTNQTVIGYNAVGNGSNTTVIGNTSTTQTQLFGNLILSNSSQPTDAGYKLDVSGSAKIRANISIDGDIAPPFDGQGNVGGSGLAFATVRGVNYYTENLTERYGGSNIKFKKNDGTSLATMFSSGNWLIQTGGTHTDNGYKLQVMGNSYMQGGLVVGNNFNTNRIITDNTNLAGFGTTTTGQKLTILAYTNTDATTSASGTVSHNTNVVFGRPTLASANTGITNTIASNVYIDGDPIAGTNTILTTKYALYVNSGNSYFGGNMYANGALILPNQTNSFQINNGFVMSPGTNPIFRPHNVTNYDLSNNASVSIMRLNDNGNIGIGTTNPSGILDVQSTTKPSYPYPRMITSQITALTGMTGGAMVYDTTVNKIKLYNGSVWVALATE